MQGEERTTIVLHCDDSSKRFVQLQIDPRFLIYQVIPIIFCNAQHTSNLQTFLSRQCDEISQRVRQSPLKFASDLSYFNI